MSMPAATLSTIRRQVTRLLPHTCTIVRVTPATYDAVATTATRYEGMPCHYREEQSRETVTLSGTELVTRSLLRLPVVYDGVSVDVAAGDRVTVVTNQLGETFGPFAIDGDPVNTGQALNAVLQAVS